MHPVSPNRNRPPTASEGRRERERRKQDQQIIEDHSERIWKYTENEILKLIQMRIEAFQQAAFNLGPNVKKESVL